MDHYKKGHQRKDQEMRRCFKCGQETKNPKFCSRKCSAVYNDRNKGRKINRPTVSGHHVLRDRDDENRTAFCTECNEIVKTWKQGSRFRCSVKQQQVKDYTREADPDYSRRYHLARTFCLSLEDYDAKLKEQDYVCAICEKTEGSGGKNLSVDHDHKCCSSRRKTCGACIRDLLCWECNSTLGRLEENIEGFIKYLEKWKLL